MISFKKALFALSFSLGLGYSLSAWAFPSQETCQSFLDECRAGDQFNCDEFARLRCHTYGYHFD